jgi:hypothetical protein
LYSAGRGFAYPSLFLSTALFISQNVFFIILF